jgi:hypothetical protein
VALEFHDRTPAVQCPNRQAVINHCSVEQLLIVMPARGFKLKVLAVYRTSERILRGQPDAAKTILAFTGAD